MNKKFHKQSLLFFFLVCSMNAFGQLQVARQKVDSIARHARGIVGVAVLDMSNGDTLTVRGDQKFPMQSVYKFPLALAVLDQVDRGKLHLEKTIHVSKTDLGPDTWSPLRERHPLANIDLPLDTILTYTVSISDNNGCDILFRLLGGPRVVDEYIHRLGIPMISIVSTEFEMHQSWNVQYQNWSTPLAMVKLLQLFYDGNILSDKSRDYLWKIMAGSRTAPKRLRGLLPEGTVVSHKSGSSGRNEKGIVSAANDVGIIVLPNGRHIAIAVFVSESDATDEANDLVIASITKTIWDAYTW